LTNDTYLELNKVMQFLWDYNLAPVIDIKSFIRMIDLLELGMII